MLQREQGRKTAGSTERISSAELMQSIPQTGHFMYCAVPFGKEKVSK
jgi:hypothetical protein